MVLISQIDEDTYCHQEVQRFICPCPQSFDLQDHETCRVTNCSPNPKELGYKPNKPNTINL